jgi:hypothetical protein
MSGLIFLIAFAFIATGIMKFLYELALKNERHDHEHSFRAELKRGQIDSRVRFSYRDGDTEFLLDAERTVREWASDYEIDGRPTPADYKLLDSILGEALAGYSPKVIAIAVSGLPAAEPPVTTPTEAQKLDGELMNIVDCVETIQSRVAWLKEKKSAVAGTYLKSGRTVARELEDIQEDALDRIESFAQHKVNGIFHDPQRQR